MEVHANAAGALIKRDVHSTHRQEKGTDQRTGGSQSERGRAAYLINGAKGVGETCSAGFCQKSDFGSGVSFFFFPGFQLEVAGRRWNIAYNFRCLVKNAKRNCRTFELIDSRIADDIYFNHGEKDPAAGCPRAIG